LFHYHGLGVPRPTHNGEIWTFDAKRTEYIASSVADVRTWPGKPSIVSVCFWQMFDSC
jgi:regulator-associated protein of mTOR